VKRQSSTIQRSKLRKVILIRVGIDSTRVKKARKLGTDQTVACAGWNAPVNPKTLEFAYVPILENSETKIVRREYEELCSYEQFKRPCEKIRADPDAGLPARFYCMCSHLDPDFGHLTYGDEGRKGKRLVHQKLAEDDILAFYAGLSPPDLGVGKFIYALIGLYVLADDPVKTTEDFRDNKQYWHMNAHTRRCLGDDDIVFRGKEGRSGRLTRCICIGEYRCGRYYLKSKIQEEWQEPKPVYLQRSPHRALCHPERFWEWFEKQGAELKKENNPV
jgi:hypothetical protein